MTLQIVQVDAFTSRPFTGNPAAVCVLPEPRDAAWMQNVASEMNLAETAFLDPREDGFDLRWFTPAVEVDLCGHATLASAHVLWESGRLPPAEAARFHTRSGLLTAVRRGDWIDLDFPATPEEETAAPPGLAEALGAAPRYVGRSRFDYLVELDSEDSVRALRPDFGRLCAIAARGVIATSRSATPDFDFRVALLRACRGDQRGSGHRLLPLLPRAVLEPPLEEGPVSRPPGLGAGRHPQDRARRRACAAGRPGRDGPAVRTARLSLPPRAATAASRRRGRRGPLRRTSAS